MKRTVRSFASFLAVAGMLFVLAPAQSEAGKKRSSRSAQNNLSGIVSQVQSFQGNNQNRSATQANNQATNLTNLTSNQQDKARLRLNDVLSAAGPLLENRSFNTQNKNGLEKQADKDEQQANKKENKRSLLFARHDFCKAKHRSCWWWYDYCHRIRHCHPQHYCAVDWYYLTCDYFLNHQLVSRDARWYLGIKGMILPGKGLGIEYVAPGSPADLAGLSSGLVLLRCNGIDLFDEHALHAAVAHSNGILVFDVLGVAGGQPYPVTIAMRRLRTVAY